MVTLQLKRASLALLLAILAVTASTPQVLAHASLIRSEPADNAILTDPPQQVRLWFNEAISPEFSTAQILDINGKIIKPAKIQVDSTDPRLMILTLPELSSGLYSVRWRVLSETDGHFTQGPLVFGVGEGINTNAATVVEMEPPIPFPEVILRWINYSVLMGLVGAVVVTYLVFSPKGGATVLDPSIVTIRHVARRRALGWAKWCAVVGVLVGIGLLIWQVFIVLETLPEDVSIWSVGWQLLIRTRWGILWLSKQAILLMLAALIFWVYPINGRGKSRIVLSFVAVLLLALLIIQALIGHAAATTPNTALAIVADILHLLAASMWIGGLSALIIGLLPVLRRDKSESIRFIRTGWRPFSRLAAVSVGLLLATGLYSMGRQVASIDALISTLYGQALLAKIGLMLMVGAFGFVNSVLLHPRLATPLRLLLRRPRDWTPLSLRQLPTLVLVEAGLGLVVVLMTGLVTATPQARGPEFEVRPDEIPTALDQTVDDMVVTFSAKPNRPGQNVIAVRAVSIRRPPPAKILRVILRFTFLGQDMGRTSADAVEVEPGFYQLGGNQLSLAGPWEVQVAVRREGLEDSVARFRWTVAPPGEPRPVVISTRSLEPALTLVAALMILVIPLILAGIWLVRGKFANIFHLHRLSKKDSLWWHELRSID